MLKNSFDLFFVLVIKSNDATTERTKGAHLFKNEIINYLLHNNSIFHKNIMNKIKCLVVWYIYKNVSNNCVIYNHNPYEKCMLCVI